ncbi:MAG: sigma-70 family RNA polymerase sigma factor [Clostridiaceae bacterium]|nr:sigma-70 family RNA polymerase sigma factor [Clostridiaceae bacterium]
MERTDSVLVSRCLNGDNEAFAELISRYKRLIYSVAYKFSKDNEEVNDMAQEAFIKIYRSLSRYDDQYKFSTWSVKVATNICLDHVRRKKINLVALEEVENFTGTSNSPEEYYLRKEKSQVLKDAIDELPEIYRVPIVMYHQKGMSYKEIAEHLDKPMSIIKNRIFRARNTLKQNLAGAVM